MNDNLIPLHPRWKDAVPQLMSLNPEPGFVIRKEWLNEMFGLQEPQGVTTVEKVRDYQFAFLTNMERFKEELLERHALALRTLRGEGYEIVSPGEQTRFAKDEGMRLIAKGVHKMGALLTNIQYQRLDAKQRSEHANALAKLSMMRSMLGNRKRVEMSTQKDEEEGVA